MACRWHAQILVEYWREGFDWRVQEGWVNSFANFRAEIDGVGVRFIHERGRGTDPLPLVLRGWPSSLHKMLDLVPLPTGPKSHGAAPSDSFDVVASSGHGFSDRPMRRGLPRARAIVEADGGDYERFAAHAYDLGAGVMVFLHLDRAERAVGYRTTSHGNPAPYLGHGAPELTDAERAFLECLKRWSRDEEATPASSARGLGRSPTA